MNDIIIYDLYIYSLKSEYIWKDLFALYDCLPRHTQLEPNERLLSLADHMKK